MNAAKPAMITDEARIKSLYAGLYRTIIRLGLLIVAAWLFAAFSFYLSAKTGTDWFTRSGAVMGLVGAAVTFSRQFLSERARHSAKGRSRFNQSDHLSAFGGIVLQNYFAHSSAQD